MVTFFLTNKRLLRHETPDYYIDGYRIQIEVVTTFHVIIVARINISLVI